MLTPVALETESPLPDGVARMVIPLIEARSKIAPDLGHCVSKVDSLECHLETRNVRNRRRNSSSYPLLIAEASASPDVLRRRDCFRQRLRKRRCRTDAPPQQTPNPIPRPSLDVKSVLR